MQLKTPQKMTKKVALNPFLYTMELNLISIESTSYLVTVIDGVKIPTGKADSEPTLVEADSFTKVYNGIPYAPGLLKEMGNNGRHLFLYMIYRIKPEMDTIVLEPGRCMSELGISERAYYSAIKQLCLFDLIQKVSNQKEDYNYWINPRYFFVGDRKAYFTKNNPDAVKVVKSIKKTRTYVELTD